VAERDFGTTPRGIFNRRIAQAPELPWTANSAKRTLKRWTENSWRLLALPLLLLIAVPIVMLFLQTSPRQLIQNLQAELVLQAVWVSLRTTLISLAVTVLAGTPLAYLMSRQPFTFKRLVDTLIDMPTVLPPSVAGVALLIALGRNGLIGGWLDTLGVHLAFSTAAVVIAQVFVSSSFFVRAATLAFSAVDEEIEQAAQLDGASRWQIFRFIILPLSRTALVSGSMMSWARALGEFGATIIFAGNFPGRTQTMPMAIYLGFEVNINLAITLAVILLTISFLSILIIKGLSQPES
jgi:molybdate transport system permease protein